MGSCYSKDAQESKTELGTDTRTHALSTDENEHITGLVYARKDPDEKHGNEKEYCSNNYFQDNETERVEPEGCNFAVDFNDTDRTTSLLTENGTKKKKHKKKSKKNRTSRTETPENQVHPPGTIDRDYNDLDRLKHTKSKTASKQAEAPPTGMSENEVQLPGFTTSDNGLDHTKGSFIPNERELLDDDKTDTVTNIIHIPDAKPETEKKHKRKKKKTNIIDSLKKSNNIQPSDYQSSHGFSNGTSSMSENGEKTTKQMYEQGPDKHKSSYRDVKTNMIDKETQYTLMVGSNQTRPIVHYEQQVADLRTENDELKNRISKMISDLVTDNNPNIADISDQNRPSKIGERFWELYNNEWTDACESLNSENVGDIEAIGLLLDLIVKIDTKCRSIVTKDMEALEKAILQVTGCSKLSDELKLSLKLYKDHRKKNYKSAITPTDEFVQSLLPSGIPLTDSVEKYISLGYELCWLMCIQDPPVYLVYNFQKNALFDKQYFKEYTQSGPLCDYMVWPVICLYENGPVLQKGVMQGKSK